MSIQGINCQRCNTPLKIDQSLIGLSNAQQKLLIGRKSEDNEHIAVEDANQFIPPDRLLLYNKINQKGKKPIFERNFTSLRNNTDTHDEEENEDNDGEEEEEEEDIGEEEAGDDDEYNSGLVDSNSFVLLPASNKHPDHENEQLLHDPKTISQRINTLNRIFEILSSNQDVDHPLCLECSDLLVENFKLKFDQNQKEKDSFLGFLRKLKSQENAFDGPELDSRLSTSVEEYHELRDIEKVKLDELRDLERTKLDLDKDLLQLEREYDQLTTIELSDVLRIKNQTDLDLESKTNELEKAKASYQMSLDQLDRLRNLNIYTSVFSISFDKNTNDYGTINGFRLGYKVPWAENNAALGQTVLLLVFLLNRFEINLIDYKLIPMGSQSHIIKISTRSDEPESHVKHKSKTILDLYTTNEFSLGKLFNFNKLDVSMIALLDILSQVISKLLEVDPDIVLPYPISAKKDTIGGKSIRVTSNSEWTLSCKFLLTNLNWLLSYSSVH
ncbi:autophagy-related protein 6 [[Candida] anglica]|uniref:Autophagy-related protein 6 n=1 Tax=[Candida] anglica TaxID=148631 RepID=A0ABP0EG14_9ASCO